MTYRAQVPGARNRGAGQRKRILKPPSSIAEPSSTAPKNACACGGSCPKCAGKLTELSAQADASANERQAEAFADSVTRSSNRASESSENPSNSHGGEGSIDVSMVSAGLRGGGEPLDASVKAQMEEQTGHDLDGVRVHKGAEATRSARSINANAFTYGDDIAFRSDRFDSRSIEGQQLIAHEVAHAVQQREMAALYVARSPDDWLTGSVNVRSFSYTQLLGEIDELVQWQNRQIESSADTVRIEEALRVLRREAARREAQTQQRRRQRRRRRRPDPAQTMEQAPTRRPRVLIEMNSVNYEDPAEMRAEFDLIMEWLAMEDLPSAERELLNVERQNLAPQLQQDRQQIIQERRTARLRTALTPSEQDEARALEHSARAIAGIERDPGQPGISYIYHGGERIPIATSQADDLRSELLNQLQRAHRTITNRVQYYMDRYKAQKDLNEETFAIDRIAGWLGGVSDPGAELGWREARAHRQLAALEEHAREGHLVQAAAALAPLERNAQVIRSLSRAFYEGHIEGAGMAITGLEFTRDASFAIAGSIAAVVAAPVVAGAVAGTGATGALAGVATTAGTGLVVGTGTAAVRGTSSAVGHGFAGSSRDQIAEAFVGEAITGFRDGFMAGAAGGAARVLGPALGVGTQLSGQLARRIAAGAIVDGTSSMVEVLLRGGSLDEAVAAGLRSAALSVPGSVVGASGNRLVREIGGPLTAGGTAYLGAIGNGATPEEAMRAAGLAVTSNIVMNRAQHGSEADAELEARGRVMGENLRAGAARARRRVASTTAAIMIGTADPIPALRSGYGGTATAQVDSPTTSGRRGAATTSAVDTRETTTRRGGAIDADTPDSTTQRAGDVDANTPDTATARGGGAEVDTDAARAAAQPSHNEVDLPPIPDDAPPLELADPQARTQGAAVPHNELDLPEAPPGSRPLELADEDDIRFDLIPDPHNEIDMPLPPGHVVTRLEDVDVSPASLTQDQRQHYEDAYTQYRDRIEAQRAAGQRSRPPMSQEDYVRFRHGIASGQLQRGTNSQVAAMIDEALEGAVHPEQAFGFDPDEVDAARTVMGRPMTSAETEELGRIWDDVENPGERGRLTRENSRGLFDNHRNRFWRRVRASRTARALFERMGFEFPENPTTAPIRELPDGRVVRVTIDHITERQADPTQALDSGNLRFAFGRENSVMLRLITELDPFQNH